MALVIQKYGGTSVADIQMIKNVARQVIKTAKEGQQTIVVISAMAGETDRLINLTYKICDQPDGREYDSLVSTGEQVSSALLSMALQSMGQPAISFLGHQIRIITDEDFSKARIKNIDSEKILDVLNQGKIVVVAGFQGVDKNNNITTLGRGGSDTTAVALASALKADICEIYTDVEGVYTTDPNICEEARKLDRISYDEMLEMASLGAKVLHTRSVQFAKKYNVIIHVRSTFNDRSGTIVCKEDEKMERVVVSGVTYNKDEAKITISKIPDRPGIASLIFSSISEAGIIVDMIIQNVGADDLASLTFTVPKSEMKKALSLTKKTIGKLGSGEIKGNENIAKVSIIGAGMRTHAGIASKMFTALAKESINIKMISTSEIKVSCVIDDKYTELAVRVLHDTFGLGKEDVKKEG
jgi:aspartate kinase